ncbi:ABC transporter permease [Salininema proteolyticum]|uniref:ABC transporter permease n=1 Tax=Salininema proteolyticum TaxID=1607685 RepID=A0ABV8TV82_9ACTN
MTVTENRPELERPAAQNGTGTHPKAGVMLLALGVLFGLAAYLWADSDRTTAYTLGQTVSARWEADTLTVVLVLSAVAAAIGVAFLVGIPKTLYKIGIGVALLALVVGAISWAMPPGAAIPVEFLLAGTLFQALPYIFGALAGVVSERSGVINIGIEAQFLTGAFTAALIASITDNAYFGMAAAAVSGMLSTLLLAWLATRFAVNQVVTGVILNLLAVGLTGFLYERVMRQDNSLNVSHGVPSMTGFWDSIGLGFLTDIPVLGPVLFRQNIFVYIAIAAVFVLWFLLFRTRWGLRTRSVGEHPAASDSVGINVNRLRFWNVTCAGALSGFGGAFFTIANSVGFTKNMTAGLGFVALAVMIVGRWNPIGVLAGALVFGFFTALATYLNSVDGNVIPTEFLSMLPYAVTLVVVAGLIGKAVAPKADGTPYQPGDK